MMVVQYMQRRKKGSASFFGKSSADCVDLRDHESLISLGAHPREKFSSSEFVIRKVLREKLGN